MPSTSFKVSAKTARLIGRENINDSNGALVELIKNGYDADATEIIVIFDMVFSFVPNKLSLDKLNLKHSDDEITKILTFYEKTNVGYVKKKKLNAEDEKELFELITKYNQIVVIDNGHGMSETILNTKWMNIGTDDKEINKVSPIRKRVKTGAKGIGRFALDKLSKYTLMYTKSYEDKLIDWHIDWSKIDNSESIEDVEAKYYKNECNYWDYVKNYLIKYEIDYNKFDSREWKTGTLIVLKQLREEWSKNLFNRINNNLETLMPIGTPDEFNIIVKNVYDSKYDFISNTQKIDKSLYDYKISASFDGLSKLNIDIERNELITEYTDIDIVISKNNIIKKNINEFWNREAFKIDPFKYESLENIVHTELDVYDYIDRKKDYIKSIDKVGPFSMEFYFLKNANSEVPIIRRINVSRRKRLLESFSGIKIYRDKFKVRPYGEEDGPSFDWLNLGGRAQKSPAAPSHPRGKWRVLPYQFVGSINISRENNSFLEDMANRESIKSGDVFEAFRNIIICVINEFEFDRQYFYREYSKWTNEIEKENKSVDYDEVVQKVLNDGSTSNDVNIEEKEDIGNHQLQNTLFEYKETIKEIHKSGLEKDDELRLYRAFSASGIIVNTFSHELKAIQTNLIALPAVIKLSLNNLLKNIKIEELGIYNPYSYLEEIEETNKILKSWVDVVMATVENSNIEQKSICINTIFHKIANMWKSLLKRKYIKININEDKKYFLSVAICDLYLILNNFILNSCWFLDRTQGREKYISIDISSNEQFIRIKLFNSGIELDKKYNDNPSKIFDIGESTKIYKDGSKGTGLGMFFIKDSINKMNGSVVVEKPDLGFLITILLPMDRSEEIND